jgi:hypothetical protein
MYIYNVTIQVQDSIHEAWLNWLREEHIPEVLQTGCFRNATILQLLDTDEGNGPTYAVQYRTESRSGYDEYIEKFAGVMRQRSVDRWGDKFIAFRSIMRVVN